MVITTLIFAVVARRRWHWSTPRVALVVGFFLVIDLAFFAANIVKIPYGGWLPLVAAVLIYIVMTTWKRGTWLVFTHERSLELTLPRLLQRVAEEQPVRIPGDAVFLSANRDGTPAALLANLKYNGVLHERVLLLNVQYADIPYVPADQRTNLEHLGHQIYRATLHFGFMEDPNVPETLHAIKLPGKPFVPENVPFFVNRTKVTATAMPGMAPWRERLFATMSRNAGSVVEFFRLPDNAVVELGTRVQI
jgi:KUP system potassium uptake protein